MKYLLILPFLFGCSLAGRLPSMQHCDEVTYTRQGRAIEIHAICTAPPNDSGGIVDLVK